MQASLLMSSDSNIDPFFFFVYRKYLFRTHSREETFILKTEIEN